MFGPMTPGLAPEGLLPTGSGRFMLAARARPRTRAVWQGATAPSRFADMCSPMPRLRAVLVLVLIALIAYGTTVTTLDALRPAAFGEQADSPRVNAPVGGRLARHVLLVVVDGLRWDVAHDAQILPRLAASLQQHTSAEVWSSPISMTSSAVLAYGTGQRASLDQVLENLRPPKLSVNSWIQNAHAAGRTLMGCGDPAWRQLYGPYFRDFRADPAGVAISVDFDSVTFAAARELQSRAPDFLVAHFVTPDHQGHAYGIRSARYREHMRAFDQQLFAWLDELPRDWTVLITSDHGAAESGTHGTDTPEQRRSPLLAYGPGIRSGIHLARRVDQAELPGLFAALLGVPNAEQSRAAALLEWLDVSPEQRRRLACAEIARIERLRQRTPMADERATAAAAHDRCCEWQTADACVGTARATATRYDAELGRGEGLQSRQAWPWLLTVLAASFGIVQLLWGKRALTAGAWLSAWLACSLALTLYVERLPGVWPNAVRALLFGALNLLLLVTIIRFQGLRTAFERWPALLFSILPGWLLVSYSTNTQIQAYLTLIALAARVAFPPGAWKNSVEPRLRGLGRSRALSPRLRGLGHSRALSPRLRGLGRSRTLSRATIGLLGFGVAGLALAGTRPSDVRPVFFLHHPILGALTAGSVLLFGLLWWLLAPIAHTSGDPLSAHPAPIHERLLDPREAFRARATAASTVLLCFTLQHLPLHRGGRLGWLATVLVAAWSWWRKQREAAFGLALASYAWVARDYEWLIVLPALVLADRVGAIAFAKPAHDSPMRLATAAQANDSHASRTTAKSGPSSHSMLAATAVHVTLLFSLTTLLRFGLQGGIQLETLDLSVGTFGGQGLPTWLSAALLAYKFVIAQALVLAAYLRHAETDLRARLLLGLGAAHLVRTVSLLLMLFVCGQSYWTAFRVVADLPLALLSALGVLPALVLLVGRHGVGLARASAQCHT